MLLMSLLVNSDSYADQALKEKIRDELKNSLGKQFSIEDSYDSVRNKIIQNLGMIEEISETAARKAKLSYDVAARFGEFEFPSIRYGDLVLPAGKYQALKVTISATFTPDKASLQ